MKNYLIGAVSLVLVVGGSILAYPGPDGQHIAGTACIIAGLYAALELMRSRK